MELYNQIMGLLKQALHNPLTQEQIDDIQMAAMGLCTAEDIQLNKDTFYEDDLD